jgi:hypothetical protein
MSWRASARPFPRGKIARIGFEDERDQQTIVDFGYRPGEGLVAGHHGCAPDKTLQPKLHREIAESSLVDPARER